MAAGSPPTLRYRDLPDPGFGERLRRFADIAAPDSPLSAAFARAAADDATAHEILGGAPAGRPAANLLLAAVQYLLLSGVDHPLADHYPGIRPGATPQGDAAALFLDFCRTHRQELAELVSTRGVQTNEVRRAAILVPALAAAGGEPIALIEVGASAGFLLCYDRYRYRIGDRATGPDSPLVLTTEVRSGTPEVPVPLPGPAWRAGIDLSPVDLDDVDSVRWGRALLWPEQADRHARYQQAVDLVGADPPRIEAGDALEMLPGLAEEAPPELALTVVHSFVLNQFSEESRDRFDALLRRLASRREVRRIAIEQLRPGAMETDVEFTRYHRGETTHRSLGTAHHHGAWLAWADPGTLTAP